MAIAKKRPDKTKPDEQSVKEKPTVSEKKIAALIEVGGTSTKARQEEPTDDDEEKVPIKLLPYRSQLKEIEQEISIMPKRTRLSRHAWIIQAIDEKLERSRKKQK